MFLIFSILICLICIGVVGSWYISLTKEDTDNISINNKFSLLKDGIRSYFKWQFHPFLFYTAFIAVLLSFIHYQLFNVLSWQVPVVFLLGVIVSTLLVYIVTFISFYAQKKLLYLDINKYYFPKAFKGSALVGVFSTGLTFLGILVVFLLFGSDYLLHYALGSSLVVVFAQINGGIFAKAFEIGNQIIAGEYKNIAENDVRSPSSWGEKVCNCTISIGSYVSTIMNSYLIAFAGAVLVISFIRQHNIISVLTEKYFFSYFFIVYTVGLVAVLAGAVYIFSRSTSNPMRKIVHGMYISMLIMALLVLVNDLVFPLENYVMVFWAVLLGLIGAIIVSFVSEYYGSSGYSPVRKIAEQSQFSPINAILGGSRYGMKSMFFPVTAISLLGFFSYKLGGMIFIVISIIGMMSLAGIIVAVNVFASNINNTKLLHLLEDDKGALPVEHKELSRVGDTSQSIASGYTALISFLSSLVLLILLGYFLLQGNSYSFGYSIAFVVIGAFVPYIFIYFVIKGVNDTSIRVYEEAHNQINNIPYLTENKTTPDLIKIVRIIIRKAQKYSFAPVFVAVTLPLIIGWYYGTQVVFMFLLGVLVSGALMAIILSNMGSLLSSVKKYIKAGNFGGEGTSTYYSATIASMVGTPLKDVIAPTVDVLIKIMLLLSLVAYPLFK